MLSFACIFQLRVCLCVSVCEYICATQLPASSDKLCCIVCRALITEFPVNPLCICKVEVEGYRVPFEQLRDASLHCASR